MEGLFTVPEELIQGYRSQRDALLGERPERAGLSQIVEILTKNQLHPLAALIELDAHDALMDSVEAQHHIRVRDQRDIGFVHGLRHGVQVLQDIATTAASQVVE